MAFRDIPGNARIKKILQLALTRDRVPNSILFCGPKGSGKRKTALSLAKALNCLQRTDDACDECLNCRNIDKGTMPDVMSVDVKSLNAETRNSAGEIPEGESSAEGEASVERETLAKGARKRTIGIKTMISLKDIARLRPMVGRRRVFIIDEAEKMTEPAANAHLKIFEEPPLFTHIILISEKPALLLPTVRSRCQTLSFQRLADEDVEAALLERGMDAARARILARLVRGNLDEALGAGWEDIEQKRRAAWALFRALAEATESSAFLERFAFGRRSQVMDDLGQTLEHFSSFGRDLLLLKEDGPPDLLYNPDLEAGLRECGARFSRERAGEWLDLFDSALGSLERYVNTNLLSSSLYSQLIG